jgi:hypothetical protein
LHPSCLSPSDPITARLPENADWHSRPCVQYSPNPESNKRCSVYCEIGTSVRACYMRDGGGGAAAVTAAESALVYSLLHSLPACAMAEANGGLLASV